MSTFAHGTMLSRVRTFTLVIAATLGSLGSSTQAAQTAERPAAERQDVVTPKIAEATVEGLPHRQEWELFRQADSPSRDCPGGTAMLIEVAGALFFLECLRIHP